VKPMNHTDVVSVEDLETLIGDARQLASEDGDDRLPAIVDDGDLVVDLAAARAAGGSSVCVPGTVLLGMKRFYHRAVLVCLHS